MTPLLRFAAALGVTLVAGWAVWAAMNILGAHSPAFAMSLYFVTPPWIVLVFKYMPPDFDRPYLQSYFRPKKSEREGRVYGWLGVLLFQSFLERVGLGIRKPDFRVQRNYAFLQSLEQQTRAAEAAHGVCFIVGVLFAIYAVSVGSMKGGFWLVLLGALSQGYPVMLQRYHRPRLRRILARLKRMDRQVPNSGR